MDKHISQIERDEHDASVNAKKVTIVSGTTINAVVNTGAAADSTVKIGFATVAVASSVTIHAVVNTAAAGDSVSKIGFATVNVANTVPVTFSGNVTLSDAKTYIGLTTTTLASSIANIGFATVQVVNLERTITGNVTLSDSKTYIGLTTTTLATSIANIGFATVSVANTIPVTLAGNVTLDAGSKTQIAGNVTISDSKGFIGLTTTVLASAPTLFAVVNTAAAGQASVALDNSLAKIGFATVHQGSTPWTTSVLGNVTLSDAKTYIGLTTTTLGAGIAGIGFATVNIVNLGRTITGNMTLTDSLTYIGLTTTTLGIGTRFIGLVTAESRNAGTSKTLISRSIAISAASLTTVYVPTNTFKTTNIILNSNATVRIAIRSGATYLAGNASIGVTLFPGGGWVETGSPDSPTYIGATATDGLIIEKFDTGGIISNIGGKIVLFDE